MDCTGEELPVVFAPFITWVFFTGPFTWLVENWVEVYAGLLLVATLATLRRADLFRSDAIAPAIAAASIYVLVYPSPSRLLAVTLALVNIWRSEGLPSWPVMLRGPFKRLRAWYGGGPPPPAPAAATAQ